MSSTYLRSDTSEWLKFFEAAGIPSKIALNYAMLFADHRIQKSQLTELSKTLLNEIGITAVGDVLAIVKHSKLVATEEAEKMTFEEIKLRGGVRKLQTAARSSSPWNVTKSVSRKSHSAQSVFDRLGSTIGREESLMRKNVKFASGTKEGFAGSPEVSSTTKDDFPMLESDKLKRKISALGRLGPKTSATTREASLNMDSSPLTETKIVVTGGQRKILTPLRRTISATGARSSGALGSGSSGSSVKMRLGVRTAVEAPAEKSNVFNRLGTRQSF